MGDNYGKGKKKFSFQGSREARAICKNNAKAEIREQAMEKICYLQGGGSNLLFVGDFEIKVKIVAKSKADIDNITKGILDALQGTAYGNDRNCRKMSAEFC